LLGLEDSPFKGSGLKPHWQGLGTSAGHPDAHTMQIVWGKYNVFLLLLLLGQTKKRLQE